MQNIANIETVDPQSLQGDEKKTLGKKLFELHQKIFEGIDESAFFNYVMEAKSARTRIYLLKNDTGELVGYCAVHRFPKPYNGSRLAIFRVQAGIVKEYRGTGTTLPLAFKNLLAYKLCHPFEKTYFLSFLVHPSSYQLLAHSIAEMYPHRDRPTPPQAVRLMSKMADAFDEPRISGKSPLVRGLGVTTKDSSEERRYWLSNPDPNIQFFIKNNPGYTEGNGLATLVPVTGKNLFLSVLKHIKGKFQR